MKLNFRDLKQQKFTIDAEPSETVSQIKDKIAAEKGWEASQQKLIYSGKILADTNTVESYNIEEKGFIVCMVSKPKGAPSSSKPAQPSTPAVSASTPAQPPTPQPNPSTTAAQSNPPATPTPASSTATTGGGGDVPSSFNDPSALLVGQRSQEAVSQMEAMGFQRGEIERAMRAAFFNPDRAIEYLLTGIPEHVQAEQRQSAPASGARATAPSQGSPPPQPPAASQSPQNPDDEGINLFEAAAQAGQQGPGARGGLPQGAMGGRGGTTAQQPGQGGQLNMDFLRNSPHFQHLRQLVQQQPAMLEPILQQVAEGNPQLAQMIGQNQEQFLQLLSEDVGGDEMGGGDGGPLPPGATAISVTEEERDAIERLCLLGFPRDAVIQAYFACDKNEELAANFLFDQPEDEDNP